MKVYTKIKDNKWKQNKWEYENKVMEEIVEAKGNSKAKPYRNIKKE